MSENPLSPEIAARRAAAQKRLATLRGCALLVGVEEYPSFPDQALPAGRNDVLAFWIVCRRLGYRPQHIRVRTSPVLTRQEIYATEVDLALRNKSARSKPREAVLAEVEAALRDVPWNEVLGPATRAGIVEGVQWLAERLVFDFRTESNGDVVYEELAALPGLFAYSGHGAQLPGDLALCPSDVKSGAGGLENALSFSELRALLDAGDRAPGGHAPTDNLTVVLDCCFAAGADADSMLASTLTAAGTPARPAAKEIGSRVFCASARDEQAYQAMLGGRWRGAFTWAFTRALEQWKTVPSGQFRRSTISHAELLFRTRLLLEALSFAQHPVLVDTIGNLPVFWHESDAEGKKETKSEPDAKRIGIQLDPDERYFFFDPTNAPIYPLLMVDALGPDPKRYPAAGKEYWFSVGSFPLYLNCRISAIPADASIDSVIRDSGWHHTPLIATSDTAQPVSVWSEGPIPANPGVQSYCYVVNRDWNLNLVGIQFIYEAGTGIVKTNWFVKTKPKDGEGVVGLPAGSEVLFDLVSDVSLITGYSYFASIRLTPVTQ